MAILELPAIFVGRLQFNAHLTMMEAEQRRVSVFMDRVKKEHSGLHSQR